MWKRHQLVRAATFTVSSVMPGAAAVLSPIVVFVAAWDWVSQSPEGFFVALGVSFLIVKSAMSWWYGDLRFLLLDAKRVPKWLNDRLRHSLRDRTPEAKIANILEHASRPHADTLTLRDRRWGEWVPVRLRTLDGQEWMGIGSRLPVWARTVEGKAAGFGWTGHKRLGDESVKWEVVCLDYVGHPDPPLFMVESLYERDSDDRLNWAEKHEWHEAHPGVTRSVARLVLTESSG